jgi:transcriptional regulator with XRE-family HTH domain
MVLISTHPKTMKRFVGENIRHARTSLGLTTHSLSLKLGISRSYLTLIETGVRPLPKRLVNPLSSSLNISKNTIKEWYLEQSLYGLVDNKSLALIKLALHLSSDQKSYLLSILKRI